MHGHRNLKLANCITLTFRQAFCTGRLCQKLKVTKQENVMIKAVNINRRYVICIECYKELSYGMQRISSAVQFNDAIVE